MVSRVFADGLVISDGVAVRGDVVVVDGLVTEVREHRGKFPAAPTIDGSGPAEVIDCAGRVVAPGFIDLQCNGAAGHDITSHPDSIDAVAEVLPRFGVTSFLPTVVTSPAHQRERAVDTMAARRSSVAVGADAMGLHFEGPMISPHHLGAHRGKYLGTLSVQEIDAWVASNEVALVTLAPELGGSEPLIRRLVEGGIIVSAGHTGMQPDDLARARAAGLSYVTHLFNAMAPFGHRAPGPIGSVLADPTLVAGVIADGLHVDPVAVRMAWNVLGPERMSLVSDAVGALGMPYGRLSLAGFEVVHDETGVHTGNGVLAGSALALDQAVRNLIAWTGCDLVDALATVTTTPATLLGLTDRGRIAAGLRADLVILDDHANLLATYVGGEPVHLGVRQHG